MSLEFGNHRYVTTAVSTLGWQKKQEAGENLPKPQGE